MINDRFRGFKDDNNRFDKNSTIYGVTKKNTLNFGMQLIEGKQLNCLSVTANKIRQTKKIVNNIRIIK